MLNKFFLRIMELGAVQRQSIIQFIFQILITFIGFFSTIYFTRVLGASQLGAYFLFTTYFGLILLFLDGGFGTAAMKKISEGGGTNAYFSAFAAVRTLSVTIVITLLLVFRNYFFNLNADGTYNWLILALIVSIPSGIALGGITGSGKIGIYSTALFVDSFSRITIQIISVFLGYALVGMVGGFIAGVFVGALIQLHFLDLRLVRFEWKHVRSLANFSFWSFLVSGGLIIFSSVDTIILSHYMKNSDIGIYRIGLQLSGIVFIVVTSLCSSLYPKVSRWGVTGEFELIEKSLSRAITYALLIAIPIVAGGILLGDKMLYYLYGADFAFGYKTLIILFISQIVNIFQSFFITYLSALDDLKRAFKFTAVSVVTNIILNIILIPIFGIFGAAIATMISLSLNTYMAKLLLSKTIKIRLEDSVLHILEAAIGMSLVLIIYRLVIPLSIWWLIAIPVVLGGIIYFILILKIDNKIYDELKGIVIKRTKD